MKECSRILKKRVRSGLGRYRLSELTRGKISAWHASMGAIPSEANRSLAYLSAMLGVAAKEWDLISANPCTGIRRFSEKARDRYLTDAEIGNLGAALKELETEGQSRTATALIRFLLLTGMRFGEASTLQWEWVQFGDGVGAIRLPNTKNGSPRTVALSGPAHKELELRKAVATGRYAFPRESEDKPIPYSALRGVWLEATKRAKITDARPHDLRHTSGTFAAEAQFNAFMIRDHLGHKTLAMTGRYVSRADATLLAVQQSVGRRVEAALSGTPKPPSERQDA